MTRAPSHAEPEALEVRHMVAALGLSKEMLYGPLHGRPRSVIDTTRHLPKHLQPDSPTKHRHDEQALPIESQVTLRPGGSAMPTRASKPDRPSPPKLTAPMLNHQPKHSASFVPPTPHGHPRFHEVPASRSAAATSVWDEFATVRTMRRQLQQQQAAAYRTMTVSSSRFNTDGVVCEVHKTATASGLVDAALNAVSESEARRKRLADRVKGLCLPPIEFQREFERERAVVSGSSLRARNKASSRTRDEVMGGKVEPFGHRPAVKL